jgi:threonine dehydrogenase-like Zn-dependent dehydrogenase
MAKNDVRVGTSASYSSIAILKPREFIRSRSKVTTPKPAPVGPHDVLVKTTGSTVCGGDVHLTHGVVVQVSCGDILSHKFCGVVESVGSAVTQLSTGDRVVNSFCIARQECRFCKEGLTMACELTGVCGNYICQALLGNVGHSMD